MKLVILDRDGVINEDSEEFIKSPDEWIPIHGSIEAIGRLERAGWTVTVATNQSGIGRGLIDLQTLHAIHQKMHAAVTAAAGRLHGVFFCPHVPEDGCVCRKPNPGLLHQIAERFGYPLERVPLIGDSLRDIEAARAVGARPILVRTGKGTATLEALGADAVIEVGADLAAVVEGLLAEA